ncbi:hypothetical protein FRAHR75_10090 [Frankia sp. Hr75.2]|nr:hypothetical protein FRAHR75_10090 [Frankia sp. Hr75.2]
MPASETRPRRSRVTPNPLRRQVPGQWTEGPRTAPRREPDHPKGPDPDVERVTDEPDATRKTAQTSSVADGFTAGKDETRSRRAPLPYEGSRNDGTP